VPVSGERVRQKGFKMLAFEIIGAIFAVLFLAALVGGDNTVAGR
jgi:hypothetical protein